MFHGAAKYSTGTLQCSTEPLNIPRTLSNVPWIPKMIHGNLEMLQGYPYSSTETLKRSTEPLKCSTEPLIPPRAPSNVPQSP